jgi:hypothetical protein
MGFPLNLKSGWEIGGKESIQSGKRGLPYIKRSHGVRQFF